MATGSDYCALKIEYYRASRCWKSNNLKSCLLICDRLTKRLSKITGDAAHPSELGQLRHLVWFLKIRCLADDYHINESLLLNEDDIDSDEQVRIFSKSTNRNTATRRSRIGSAARTTSLRTSDGGGRKTAGGSSMETRIRTGIITGRMPTVSSRQSSRATSSYRPLTTSLTATQTAFSRSTRPLLKYASCSKLSKLIFEYLYNAQAVTNKCPDYRQCLEYLNLVLISLRKGQTASSGQPATGGSSISTSEGVDAISATTSPDSSGLGCYWLVAFGICYFNLHMNKQAEEYFQRAIVMNPRYSDCYTWLVKVYLRSNQPAKVVRTCEKGLDHCKSAILYNWRARIQLIMNNPFGANSNLRESLKYYPTNIEALANVGHFAFYSDKLEQSLRCFERIQQLTTNQSISSNEMIGNSAQLLNNLALCNFYCGLYHRVLPLFFKAFLNSPSLQVTSDIWYNISFIPLSCGFKNLAIACLRLALKSDSQNEEAINNLGVLKYNNVIEDHLHYENRQELWDLAQHKTTSDPEVELKNLEDQNKFRDLFDEAETYFGLPTTGAFGDPEENAQPAFCQPEMLYNMAIVKKKRGQLLASVRYCELYLDHDQNNVHINDMLREIRQLVSH